MNISQAQFNNILDVLLTDDYDHRAIVEKIARTNPEAILEVMSGTQLRFPMLEQYAKNNEKINAIKYVRGIEPMGLVEAKEFVEDYFASNGF